MLQNVNRNFSSYQVLGEASGGWGGARQSVSVFVWLLLLFVLKVFKSGAEVDAKSVQ